MSPWFYVAAFVGSGILSAILVALSIRLAHWAGLVDGPDGAKAAVGGAAFVVHPWRPGQDSLTATGWCHAVDLADARPT